MPMLAEMKLESGTSDDPPGLDALQNDLVGLEVRGLQDHAHAVGQLPTR